MAYETGEAAVLTLIRQLSNFDSTNSVSLANDSNNAGATLLESGNSIRYVILRPGAFERSSTVVGETYRETRWQTYIDIYELRRLGGNSAEMRLVSDRGDIIGKLDSYYRLNGTSGVNWSLVVEGDVPEEVTGGEYSEQAFIRQRLVLEWDEEVSVTQND